MKQSLDKFDKLGRSYSTLDRHETEFSLCAHGRDEVQPKPRGGRAYHGSLPFRGPRRSRMMVRTHTRFIPKEDQGGILLGQTTNTWILLLQPFLNLPRALLVRSPYGTLRRQPQLSKQAANRGFAQLHTKFSINDLPNHFRRPEGERELDLQRVFFGDGFVNPPNRFAIKLGLTPTPFPSVKSVPTPVTITGQPSVYRHSIDAQRPCDRFGTLAILDAADPAFLQFGQGRMSKSSCIHSSIFHGCQYST